jgi:diaminohydroxyphosphoribosylaminopyrimidine deaminase/5-amino-6-(5-phosphoribosylamino)uracil reductase
MAPKDKLRINISNEFSRTLAHRWRSEEAAIMIGRNTAMQDNPKLDTRLWNDRKPVRIVLDRKLQLPAGLNLFDHTAPTIVFTEKEKSAEMNLDFIRLDFENDLLKNILKILYEKQIQSVMVEGGAKLLQSLIDEGLWDEARIFIAPSVLTEGISAPKIFHMDSYGTGNRISEEDICGDQLIIFESKL